MSSKTLTHFRNTSLALMLMFLALPFSFSFEQNGLTWRMWHGQPQLVKVFLLAAIITGLGAWFFSYRARLARVTER